MYPGPAGPIGNECAGTVVSIGEGVTNVSPGDEVMVLAENTFSDSVIARAQAIYPKLSSHSFADAVTIPLAYLTAYHGLFNLAQIKAGDRVLIHAAAGGVGMAAVQLARLAGAEVFGTAGSPRKRAFLKSNGVQHVMNSRTLDFADEIMTATNGEGVDIVLNALTDEFIPRSISVLADEGCFLEIGKRGIWMADQVAALNPTLRYFPYDLADVMNDEPDFMRVTLQQMLPDFESGALQPLPLRSFPMSDVIDAFRYMARAKHIGKVVVLQEDNSTPRDSGKVLTDATYLITGGLGGLGLVMASGLVERGARHLVLMGRSGASEDAQRAMDELEQAGATVWIAEGDVSSREDVARILTHIVETMPALRGIIHAAGVVDDGMLISQTWSRFEDVMAPKIAGAWNLHMLTQDIPLDFFVMFSAGAAIIGSPGQGNYAAANAFLDGLAHFRREEGLAALSINWGAWKQVGMASILDSHERRRWSAVGIGMIEPEVGFQLFDQLLSGHHSQIGVLPMNWSAQAQQFSAGKEPPLLRQLIQSARSKSPSERKPAIPRILLQLDTADADERYGIILEFVEGQVIKVLGLDSSQQIDHQLGLTDIGMDSLMAVELSNRLESSLGQKLPSTLAFEHPTVFALADYLVTEILALPPDNGESDEQNVDELQVAIRTDVEKLSEDEAEDSLLKELKDAGY
jgi:myxalamid-type polyketide synthase MxaB